MDVPQFSFCWLLHDRIKANYNCGQDPSSINAIRSFQCEMGNFFIIGHLVFILKQFSRKMFLIRGNYLDGQKNILLYTTEQIIWTQLECLCPSTRLVLPAGGPGKLQNQQWKAAAPVNDFLLHPTTCMDMATSSAIHNLLVQLMQIPT